MERIKRIRALIPNSQFDRLATAVIFTLFALVLSPLDIRPGVEVLESNVATGKTVAPTAIPFFRSGDLVNGAFKVALRVNVLFSGGALVHIRPDECLTAVSVDNTKIPLPESLKKNLCNWTAGFDLDLNSYLAPGEHRILFDLADPGNAYGFDFFAIPTKIPAFPSAVLTLVWGLCFAVAFLAWLSFLKIENSLAPAEMVLGAFLFYGTLKLRTELLGFQLPASTANLHSWQDLLQTMGFSFSLRGSMSNLSPLTTVVYSLCTQMPFAPLACVKIGAYVADFLIAAGAAVCVAQLGGTPLRAALAAALVLFFPPLILNGGAALEGDSFYLAAVVWSLASALQGNERRSVILLGVGIAFKLSAIFYVPALLALTLQNRSKVRTLGYLAVPFFLSLLPGLALGRPLSGVGAVLGIHGRTLRGLAPAATWLSLWPADRLETWTVSITVAAVSIGLALAWSLSRKVNLSSPAATLLTFLVFAIAGPTMTPGVGENAFLGAEILALVLAVCWPSKIWLALTLAASGTLAYGPLVMERELIALPYLALAPFGVLGWLLTRFFSEANPSAASHSPEKSFGIHRAA